jgi:hypothetical protein
MAWTLTGFDRLADQLPPRHHPAWNQWLNRLAHDPHEAGAPVDHGQAWQATDLHIALCTYEICEKTGAVSLVSFYAGEDAWRAEDG